MPNLSAVIVGDVADLHVRAVLDHLTTDGVVVLDGQTVSTVVEHMEPGRAVFRDIAGELLNVDRSAPVAGWIRRVNPAGMEDNIVLGSHRAATLASKLVMLAAIIRDPNTVWVTQLDAVFAAENKLVQYAAAASLGIRVPKTRVALSLKSLEEDLGNDFVLKPLGPGNYTDAAGSQRVAYARSSTIDALVGIDLRDAPFIAQERLRAREHLRIVTIGDDYWTASLPAEPYPLDWRTSEAAHSAFVATDSYSVAARQAVELARVMRCGYTSQDWIVDEAGVAFVDLNPSGQWLFLPDPIPAQVARGIAQLLDGRIERRRGFA